jgi:hypothetical protein
VNELATPRTPNAVAAQNVGAINASLQRLDVALLAFDEQDKLPLAWTCVRSAAGTDGSFGETDHQAASS